MPATSCFQPLSKTRSIGYFPTKNLPPRSRITLQWGSKTDVLGAAVNQAALLQIWCQSLNSPTIDSSTDRSTIVGWFDGSIDIASRIDSSTVQSALQQAAIQLQTHLAHEEGNLYRLEDLQQVLVCWLESSIECLVEDALFHTLEGDRAFAFNRRAFERQMQHLQPVPAAEAISASPHSVSPTVAPTVAPTIAA